METISLLDRYLQERAFQEATTLTLTSILPVGRLAFQEAAWGDRLTWPGYSLTVGNVTIQGCPLLLGALQAVIGERTDVLAEWRESLDSPAFSFLKEQGQPLSGWHYTQAVLACAEVAIAARRHDDVALVEHGCNAAQWFNGTPPSPRKGQSLAIPFLNAVEGCFATLAEILQIPTARARDLTQWFLSPARYQEPLRTRKLMVPFYEEQENRRGVATLTMALLPGRGEFYADPVTMAFVHWDDHFEKSFDDARAHIKQLGWWRDDRDVCWRIQADPPLSSLTGGSAGGAFFAALWHLLTDTLNDILVTISAAISADGQLLPVEHITEKIRAVLDVPELSAMIIVKEQPGVEAGQYDRLLIWEVPSAANLERHSRHPER